EQRHDHRTEDRRKDAPFAIAVARLIGEKFPPTVEVDACFLRGAQRIGRVSAYDLRQLQWPHGPLSGLHPQLKSLVFRAELIDLLADRGRIVGKFIADP